MGKSPRMLLVIMMFLPRLSVCTLTPASATCPNTCGKLSPVNVRDCGAAGDDKADDTHAFLCALTAASRIHTSVPVPGSGNTDVSVAEVLFPQVHVVIHVTTTTHQQHLPSPSIPVNTRTRACALTHELPHTHTHTHTQWPIQ